jgi:glucan phosphorylase
LTVRSRPSKTGVYSPEEPYRFANITNVLRYSDYYMVAADFEAYSATQRRIEDIWRCKAALDAIEHRQYREYGLVLLRPRNS